MNGKLNRGLKSLGEVMDYILYQVVRELVWPPINTWIEWSGWGSTYSSGKFYSCDPGFAPSKLSFLEVRIHPFFENLVTLVISCSWWHSLPPRAVSESHTSHRPQETAWGEDSFSQANQLCAIFDSCPYLPATAAFVPNWQTWVVSGGSVNGVSWRSSALVGVF